MAAPSHRIPDDTESSPDPTPRPLQGDGWADDDSSIEFDAYVRAIWRRWWLIFAGAALAGAIAFVLAGLRPLQYEAVTTLLVVPPSEPGGPQINPATFRAIVENATLASQVIDELQMGDQGLTPLAFVQRALAVEEVRGTNIVKVKVTLGDPAVAAEASRRLAEKAIVLTQQITRQEGASIQEQLRNHLNDARERLDRAEKELLSYKQAAQVELIKGDTNAQLKERGDLLALVINIEAERARLAAADQEIKRQQPLLSVPRLPAAEDALRRTLAPPKGPPMADSKSDTKSENKSETKSESKSQSEIDPQHLDLTNPFVNPVYQTLDFQIATTRTRIAALERQRDEVMNVRKLGGKELAQLSELYRREIEQARLQASFDLATRVYGELSLQYEMSRTQPVGTSAQLQVIDNALPPERPVGRKRLQYALFGSAVGLVGMVLAAVLWEGFGRRTRPGAR